jgi:hypothetical protein
MTVNSAPARPVSTNPANPAVASVQAGTVQPDQNSPREVAAQELSAGANVVMAIAAVLTVGITFAGTILIWRQVRLTRKAVQDTSLATEAMQEANRIAEDNSHRQLRAYLAVQSVTVSESDWDADRLQIMLEIQNAGQTPAILRTVALRASWAYDDGSVTLIDHTSKNEVPCHRDTPMHLPFSFKCDDEALEEKGHIVLNGRVEYDDAFGKRQKEPFSFRTQEGHFCPLFEHDFPIRLAAFSPLSILEALEELKKKPQPKPENAD